MSAAWLLGLLAAASLGGEPASAPTEGAILCPHCCNWVEPEPLSARPIEAAARRDVDVSATAGAAALTAPEASPTPTSPEEWAEREAMLIARYESRIVELERQLRDERTRSLRRQTEWLEFSKLMSTLQLSPETAGPALTAEIAGADEDAAPEPEPAPDPAARMRESTLRKLKALVRAERVTSLEPLEIGEVHDGWAGPVVFRTLDERGRPSGTLVAERFHLEGSIAARSLSLCFEAGYERMGGERIPFEGTAPNEALGPVTTLGDGLPERRGERRIVLGLVDPRPWIEVLPSLFPPDQRDTQVPDDGSRARGFLRLSINRLFEAQAESRDYRLVALGGVQGDTLHDVQLQVDERGGVVRRVFADRLRVFEEDRGLSLRFEDGAVQREERRAPFLDGRYRIFLLAADPEAWRAAEVPLVSSAPAASEDSVEPVAQPSRR